MMGPRNRNPAASNQVSRPGWKVSQLVRLQELTGQAGSNDGDLLKQIEELRANIPPELLRPFDDSLEHGRAAVALVSESGCCGRCHLNLPSGMAVRVQLLEDQIHQCPYCGCFLHSSRIPPPSEASTPQLYASRRPGRLVQTIRSGSASRSKARARAFPTAAPDVAASKPDIGL